ncbi:MAG: GNAT family N-acetyltransferase [Polyangiaceae bacterium]
MQVRRLGLGDTALLRETARDDRDFDISERGEAREELSEAAAEAYLADPTVLHWVAEHHGRVEGFLHCQIIRKHAGNPLELLLYEVGVRQSARRRGVGRALLQEMQRYMREQAVSEVWVLADNLEAIQFYEACGFTRPEGMAVYLTADITNSPR